MNNNGDKVFPILETERLILREITSEDAHSIFNVFSNDKIMELYGQFPFTKVEEANKLINIFQDNFNSGKGIRWGILLKKNNRFIGTVGFHNWNERHHRAEIGYELDIGAWGKGYMHEALEAIIGFGFVSMGLNRIEAVVYPKNDASISLLLKHNFKKEGLLEEYTFYRDKFQDLYMFSLLKKNWLRSRKSSESTLG